MMHIFLDFDGVVSPHSSILNGIVPCASESGCDISYFPDIVAWINDKINSPNCEVYWLTTWCLYIDELSPVGISDSAHVIYPDKNDDEENSLYWKQTLGIQKYHDIIRENPNDIVIWIDDEKEICNHPNLDNLYSFSPDGYIGMTKSMMDEIDSI